MFRIRIDFSGSVSSILLFTSLRIRSGIDQKVEILQLNFFQIPIFFVQNRIKRFSKHTSISKKTTFISWELGLFLYLYVHLYIWLL